MTTANRVTGIGHSGRWQSHFAGQAQHLAQIRRAWWAHYLVHLSIFALSTAHWTLDTPLSQDPKLHTLHSTLHTLSFTLSTLHSTLDTPNSTLCTLHSTLYTLHFTLYTPRSIYTLHPTPYTFHSTLYTPHSSLYIPRSENYTSHSTLYTVQSRLHTLHFFTLHSLWRLCRNLWSSAALRPFGALEPYSCITKENRLLFAVVHAPAFHDLDIDLGHSNLAILCSH